MSYGPYFRYYDEHLLIGTGASKIGLIGSTQGFLVLSLSVIIGRLVDAKFHTWIAVAGGVFTFLGHLCLSFTSGQGREGEGSLGLIFLTQGFIAGLGMACYFVPSSQLAVQVRRQAEEEGVSTDGCSGSPASDILLSE